MNIFFGIIFIITFLPALANKKSTSILISLFCIPYNLFIIKDIGFNYFAVAGTVLGILANYFSKKERFLTNLAYKKSLGYILLIFLVGVIILLTKTDYSDVSLFGSESVTTTAVKYIVVYLLCILFYIVLYNETNSLEDILKYITVLNSSTFYVFLSWLGFIFKIPLPFFLEKRLDALQEGRFGGFWADYELMNEFFFIVAILSILVLLNKNVKKSYKLINIITLIISIPMAFSTGTRSLFIMIAVFLLLFIFISLKISKISASQKMLYVFVSLSAVAVIYFFAMDAEILSERMQQTIAIYQSGQMDFNTFEALVNRNYSGTYMDILEVGGALGIGPVFVNFVRGDWMVYHNVYYNIIINYGVVGLIIYLAFYFSIVKDLYDRIKVHKETLVIILFCLLVSLLIDQMKINYMREPSQMLVYWFLFAIMGVCSKKIYKEYIEDQDMSQSETSQE